MPDKVLFASGNTIENLYDAGGKKLKSRYLTKVTEVSLPATKTTLSVVKPRISGYALVAGISPSTRIYRINKQRVALVGCETTFDVSQFLVNQANKFER